MSDSAYSIRLQQDNVLRSNAQSLWCFLGLFKKNNDPRVYKPNFYAASKKYTRYKQPKTYYLNLWPCFVCIICLSWCKRVWLNNFRNEFVRAKPFYLDSATLSYKICTRRSKSIVSLILMSRWIIVNASDSKPEKIKQTQKINDTNKPLGSGLLPPPPRKPSSEIRWCR